MVLLGKLDVDLIGVYPIVGPWPFCIESRDVLEKDEGVEPRFTFVLLLKNDVQDCVARVLLSETCLTTSGFRSCVDSVLAVDIDSGLAEGTGSALASSII